MQGGRREARRVSSTLPPSSPPPLVSPHIQDPTQAGPTIKKPHHHHDHNYHYILPSSSSFYNLILIIKIKISALPIFWNSYINITEAIENHGFIPHHCGRPTYCSLALEKPAAVLFASVFVFLCVFLLPPLAFPISFVNHAYLNSHLRSLPSLSSLPIEHVFRAPPPPCIKSPRDSPYPLLVPSSMLSHRLENSD